MATVKDIYQYIDSFAPFQTQMSFDNAGFLVGRGTREVMSVLVALDITETVAVEAVEMGAQLIVSHHPVIFIPQKSVTDEDPGGRTLLTLIEGGLAAICAHTNLDAAQGGVNDVLAQALGLTELSPLEPGRTDASGLAYGIGRVGLLFEGGGVTPAEYAVRIKKTLNAASVRYADGGRPVHRVAVGGGACGDLFRLALEKGCDTFVTSDVKYNHFIDAKALGLTIMDAGHFATENVICPVLVQVLRKQFPSLRVEQSGVHGEVYDAV